LFESSGTKLPMANRVCWSFLAEKANA
jgi:hypothetical protein